MSLISGPFETYFKTYSKLRFEFNSVLQESVASLVLTERTVVTVFLELLDSPDRTDSPESMEIVETTEPTDTRECLDLLDIMERGDFF